MVERGDYDVIIIGAGHNGLIAACYLAKERRRVAVIERLPHIGGMTSSWCAIPEAPQHVVHPYGVDVIFMRATTIVEELDLARLGWRTIDPDPPYVYLHPDGSSLAFWRDPAKTVEEIRYFSSTDARAYLKFIEVIDALLGIALPMMRTDASHPGKRELLQMIRSIFRNRRLGGELIALVTGSSDQAVVERFEHPVVQAALLGLAGGASYNIDRDATGMSLILLGLLHRFGSGRPVGGIQLLPNTLAARLEELGGTINTGVGVEEIMASDGRATGVRLANDQIIKARAVVATCDPRVAVNLVTPGAIERHLVVRANYSPSYATGAAPFKIDLALSGRIDLGRHRAWRRDNLDLRIPCSIIGTAEEVRQSLSIAMRGELPPEPFMWALAISGCDPSQAPEGQDVVYLFPVMSMHPNAGWDAVREQAVASVIRKASDFMRGLDTLEIGRRVETAEELAQQLNVTNGCATHIDFGLLRSSTLRPAYGLGGAKPILAGFFLGGAGAHPGGGVVGLPGKIAATRVSKYLGRS